MDLRLLGFSKLSDLERHVRFTLCERDRLEPRQTACFRSVIHRRGRIGGYLYEVLGPRQLRNSAIWVSDENRILFYDSTGFRFGETRLSESPEIAEAETTAPGETASQNVVAA